MSKQKYAIDKLKLHLKNISPPNLMITNLRDTYLLKILGRKNDCTNHFDLISVLPKYRIIIVMKFDSEQENFKKISN